jgi:hypothetical protein
MNFVSLQQHRQRRSSPVKLSTNGYDVQGADLRAVALAWPSIRLNGPTELLWGKGRRARKDDKDTSICEPI